MVFKAAAKRPAWQEPPGQLDFADLDKPTIDQNPDGSLTLHTTTPNLYYSDPKAFISHDNGKTWSITVTISLS